MEKPTLWVVSWAIYCRRVLVYLREKGIADQIDIIEVGFESGLSAPGKPPGQIPILKIARDKFVFESTAIIEYLEDTFPQARNLRGPDSYTVARTRGFMSAMDNAVHLFLVYLANASPAMAHFGNQSEAAARSNLAYSHRMFRILERNASKRGPLLSDAQEVTVADIALAASFQYGWVVFGQKMWETHLRLEQFWDAMKDKEILDSQEFPKIVPKAMLEVAGQASVRWEDLSDEEKGVSVDRYAE